MLENIIEAKMRETTEGEILEPEFYEGYHTGFEHGVRQVLNDMQNTSEAFPEVKYSAMQPVKLIVRRVASYLTNKYFGAKNV